MTTTMTKRQLWESRWARPETRTISIGESLTACMLVMLVPEPKSTFVDFGCGTGRAARRLAEMGFPTVGLDFAANCLDDDCQVKWDANHDEKEGGVPLVIADLENLPAVKYADYGYCCDVLTRDMPYATVRGLARTTRKGVFLAIHCPTREEFDMWGRVVQKTWAVSTITHMGSLALFACREAINGAHRIP